MNRFPFPDRENSMQELLSDYVFPKIEKDKIPQDALIYDIGRGKYDHHQEDAELRENGIKYSSFGLLYLLLIS